MSDQLDQLIYVVQARVVQNATFIVQFLVLALPLQNRQELRLEMMDYLVSLSRRDFRIRRFQQRNCVRQQNRPEAE